MVCTKPGTFRASEHPPRRPVPEKVENVFCPEGGKKATQLSMPAVFSQPSTQAKCCRGRNPWICLGIAADICVQWIAASQNAANEAEFHKLQPAATPHEKKRGGSGAPA